MPGPLIEVNGATASIGALAGAGTVSIQAGELRVGGTIAAASTFGGELTGAGVFTIANGQNFTYQNAALLTGPINVLRDPNKFQARAASIEGERFDSQRQCIPDRRRCHSKAR
jgi:hypothetical protein